MSKHNPTTIISKKQQQQQHQQQLQKDKQTTSPPKHLFTASNRSIAFDQFRLSTHDLLTTQKPHSNDKKAKALIQGVQLRNKNILYRGNKYYYEDLQMILQLYPQTAMMIFKQMHIPLSALSASSSTLTNSKIKNSVNSTNSTYSVSVQCNNCGKFTQIWKFCPLCQHIHYCHEGCEMKNKFTHQREQCKPREFPNILKTLQVQIHIGSDLGQNVHVAFQHYGGMSLLLRGQALFGQITKHFHHRQQPLSSLLEGNCANYTIIQQDQEYKLLKFVNQIKSYQTSSQNPQKLKVNNIEQIIGIYQDNEVLRELQIFLLQNGALHNKTIRQIHDNHFREIFIFDYPF